MMLNAMAPQLHHQQNGTSAAENPLILGVAASSSSTNSSSVTTISSSPSSSSSASSSTTTTKHHHNNHQQQQSHNHNDDPDIRSQTSQYTNVASPTNTATTSSIPAATSTTTTTTTIAATTTAINAPSEVPLNNNKSPATQTVTSQSQLHHQQQHQNPYHQHSNNNFQSPRYNNHHSHHDSHHNYNMSYATRSSNNNQRGHNSNHNHNNHHNSHHNHHHHNQNHNHHQHHHNRHNQQLQQQQQPVDEANTAISSSASSLQTSDTTTTTVSSPAQRLQHTGPPHYVELHVNAGECVSLQLLDGQEQVVAGPATITMVSQQQNPPVPIPVQVPPGHMIHQIADENGTLKHIILSVMNTEDGSQFDSTVITLPKGTFRIDSHGELVSTNGSDGGTLTTLPQQAYFANYDGCPVAYEATTLPDSIETTTPVTTIGQALVSDSSYPYNQPTQGTSINANTASTNDKNEQEQSVENDSVLVYDKNVAATTKAADLAHQETIQSNGINMSKHNNVGYAAQDATKQANSSTNRPDNDSSASEQTKTDGAVIVANNTGLATSPETDQQMVVQDPISDTSYTAHQPLGTEMDLMNGAMNPMLPPVDGQLFGYPPCCCCCYCDPQESRRQQPTSALAVASQQDVIIAPEHAPPQGAHGPGSAAGVSSRNSAANLSHTNGVMAYPPQTMMAPLQGNMGSPSLGVPPPSGPPVHGTAMAPVSHNGVTPPGGSHLTDVTNNKMHGHSGKAGRGATSNYKQHKMMTSNVSGGQSCDRHSAYSGHYSHQSYNSIVSGNHHHQQHHYQPTEIGTSQASYKSQALLANQGPIMAGNYSPVYSGFEPVPNTMANVVSPFNKPGHGNQGSHHHNNHGHHHHNSHQQHGSNYRNSDSDNFMQRTREQYSSYGSATGVRTQHNNENNKRQTLSDKTSIQQQQQHNNNNSNRYTATNIKVISNNHSNVQPGGGVGGNNSTQVGSVSPIRSRVKGGNHHNHQTNGLRNSSHYNGGGLMQPQQMHDVKDNNVLSTMHPASSSFFHSSTPSSISTRDSSNLKSSRNNIHAHDHTAPISKHINPSAPTGGHYLLHGNNSHNKQQGLAWQQNKFNTSNKSNIATSSSSSTTTVANNSDLSGENNSIVGRTLTTNNNQVPQSSETGDKISGGNRIKADSSEVVSSELGVGKEQSAITHNQQHDSADKIEPKNDDFNPRTSRGKQKKCQNQQIRIQPSDRQSDCYSSNNNTKLTIEPVDEFVSETDGEKNSTSANDKSRVANSPIAIRSDSKSSQRNREKIASASPMKQQGKTQGGQKRATMARDKSTSQSGRKMATVDKALDSSNIKILESKMTSESVAEPSACKASDSQQSESNTNSRQSNDKQSSAEISENISNNELTNNRVTSSTSKGTCSKLTSGSQAEQMVDIEQSKHNKINKHNNNQIVDSQMKSGSPACKSSSSKESTQDSVEQSALGPPSTHDNIARINKELDSDMMLVVSQPDDCPMTTSTNTNGAKNGHQSPTITISMRTSLSENNIRSLGLSNSSIKSTQTTPQKFNASSLDGEADNVNSLKTSSSVSGSFETGHKKKATDSKRRGSSAKSEQIKLSSMPQLRLLNLNCTSVTSSSVQLRWSFIPTLAEKYGVTHNHSGFKSPALMDHFVIECSNSKNLDTNTLVSPKIVYQGCALTCRVNQLSSEKIYHFKVRRTALVTAANKADASGASNSEHLVVSEILSVTLPSVQQQSNSGQPLGSYTSKKGAGGGKSNKANSLDGTSSIDNNGNQALHGDLTTATASTGLSGSNRGYTSSHSNNSNHSSGSKAPQQQVKFSYLFRQCRTRCVTVFGKLVQKSLSTYSDTKFAGLLLTIFTIFAMLLAIFIHYYIVTPVTE